MASAGATRGSSCICNGRALFPKGEAQGRASEEARTAGCRGRGCGIGPRTAKAATVSGTPQAGASPTRPDRDARRCGGGDLDLPRTAGELF